VLRLTVYGIPAGQGSAKAYPHRSTGRIIVTHDSKRTRPWRESIVAEARQYLSGPPLDEPCVLCVAFYLPRPVSAPKRVKLPSKLPDLDKLIRAVGDALTTAGVWKDDSRVVSISAHKVYAASESDPMGTAGIPRAEIYVRAVIA
jgi:Holliday junction resolvase RusA-like endonuclease